MVSRIALERPQRQEEDGVRSQPSSRPSSPPASPAAAIADVAHKPFRTAPTPSTAPVRAGSGAGQRRILLVSDCAEDLVCGVTRKQVELCRSLNATGHCCRIICATEFWGFHAPHWNEIKIALPSPWAYWKLSSMIEEFDPDTIK
jgi:hypothetical protein